MFVSHSQKASQTSCLNCKASTPVSTTGLANMSGKTLTLTLLLSSGTHGSYSLTDLSSCVDRDYEKHLRELDLKFSSTDPDRGEEVAAVVDSTQSCSGALATENKEEEEEEEEDMKMMSSDGKEREEVTMTEGVRYLALERLVRLPLPPERGGEGGTAISESQALLQTVVRL